MRLTIAGILVFLSGLAIGCTEQSGPPAVPAGPTYATETRLAEVQSATQVDTLSPDSVRSLKLQGGVFTPRQAQAFITQPHAEAAVQLRQWDDQAKTAGLATPDLQHFSASLHACALQRA